MANPTKIPFLDLVAPHKELEDELLAVVKKSFSNAGFIGGPMVEEFEKEFAGFCDAKYCVGVNSGTDALRFAFMAAGIQPGDIVVTTPHTFIATTEAISQAGGQIAFVDINEQTYTLDPEKLREYIDKKCDFDARTGKLTERASKRKVAAIVPVHLYGQMADMDPIMDLAAKYNLLVIEDACQAHGAEYFSAKEGRWRKAGSMGDAAAFSFYPGKNLGACGEAGAATTNSEESARKMRMLRDHGQSKKYYHDVEGYNGRLDSIQAGWLSMKLRHLADWNAKRQQAAQRYNDMFSSTKSPILPSQPERSRPVYHLYVVRVQDRAGLQKYLSEAKIDTGIHYPIPLHLQKAYENLGYKQGDFPITEKVASEILSLPMYPQLTAEQQRRVVQEVSFFLSPEHVADSERTTLSASRV
jgi:dTDP-4-amino-4,6-dideoxygalactose transaminase